MTDGCKNPFKTGSLYIIVEFSEMMLESRQWSTSFPVSFTMDYILEVNSTVWANIVDKDGKVTFITDPVSVSALNGKIARVTLKIRANSINQ